jgi:hypothetical protein
MFEANFRGGAQIGWLNASWPFASLRVSVDGLSLSCLGSYSFKPDQVVALEPYGSIPFFASGIQIRHNRPDYPERMIFWCMGSRRDALATIAQSGFRATGQALAARPRGFALRWSFVIGAIVVWNLLFMLDRSLDGASRETPGPLSLLALVLLAATATALRLSPRLQQLALRDGHHFGEIRSFVVFLQFLTGFMSLVFSIVWIASGMGW